MRSYNVLATLYRQRDAQGVVGCVVSGKIKAGENVADGLENAPTVLNRLFGSQAGKLGLRVSGED